MGAIISALAGWVVQFVVTGLLVWLGYLFSDVILGLIASFVDLGVSAVNGTGVSFPSVNTALNTLPLEMRQAMVRIRLDDAFAIIVSAMSVRFAGGLFNTLRGLRAGS